MNYNIFKFLKQKYSTEPCLIDRLFVSAFLKENNIIVTNNAFIKSYIIDKNDINEQVGLELFLNLLHKDKDVSVLDFETLISLFEFVISPADRIINGAVYTPNYIREYITTSVFDNTHCPIEDIKVADIACGCGGFLFNAAKILHQNGLAYRQIFASNLFGLDIQEYSILRTKLLLSLLAISEGEDICEFTFNLHIGDALEFSWSNHIDNFGGFTMVLGNPPYVRLRNLNKESKSFLRNWEVCKTGLTDLYIPFFQLAIENLAQGGIMGFITMNSFFKSLNGRALRDYLHRKSLKIRIIDFECTQIFKSRNTYTCICTIENIQSNYIEYKASDQLGLYNNDEKFSKIKYTDLNPFLGWNLKKNEVISRIEAIGTPLGKKYTTRHGIATLKNNVYIFSPIKEDNYNYYFLSNGDLTSIEKGVCRDVVNPNIMNRFQNIDDIKEKLIFPYIVNDTKAQIIEEKELAVRYPLAYNYLLTQKDTLTRRDKGEGKYQEWYAFGRTQSLVSKRNKLFFPKISNKSPLCTIVEKENLYYYNGQAIISESAEELLIIKKILESRLFWFYIINTSKPYSSKYYSLNGNYIKNFGVYNFSKSDKLFLLQEDNKDKIDSFLETKYMIKLQDL